MIGELTHFDPEAGDAWCCGAAPSGTRFSPGELDIRIGLRHIESSRAEGDFSGGTAFSALFGGEDGAVKCR